MQYFVGLSAVTWWARGRTSETRTSRWRPSWAYLWNKCIFSRSRIFWLTIYLESAQPSPLQGLLEGDQCWDACQWSHHFCGVSTILKDMICPIPYRAINSLKSGPWKGLGANVVLQSKNSRLSCQEPQGRWNWKQSLRCCDCSILAKSVTVPT